MFDEENDIDISPATEAPCCANVDAGMMFELAEFPPFCLLILLFSGCIMRRIVTICGGTSAFTDFDEATVNDDVAEGCGFDCGETPAVVVNAGATMFGFFIRGALIMSMTFDGREGVVVMGDVIEDVGCDAFESSALIS
jgi:hypothetical protein